MTLIKNELYKILHKRSTKVFLIIALIFVILTNLIYRFSDNLVSFSTTYYEDYDVALNYVNDYENSGIGDKELYNYYKSFIETYDLASNYDSNSWQYQKYMEDYWNLLQEYYRYLDEELDASLISNELEETKNNIVVPTVATGTGIIIFSGIILISRKNILIYTKMLIVNVKMFIQ